MNTQEQLNNLSHVELEILSEIAEEFLDDQNIELTSHSYRNIINQAIRYGFELPEVVK